jgi:hypothetical protein
MVISTLNASVAQGGSVEFLTVVGLDSALPGFITEFLHGEVARQFSSIATIYEWYAQDLSAMDHVKWAQEGLESHVGRLKGALSKVGLLSEKDIAAIATLKRPLLERLEERAAELQERDEERAEAMQDEWKDRYAEERYELESGRFADVDE